MCIPKDGGTAHTVTYGAYRNVGGDLISRNEAALESTEETQSIQSMKLTFASWSEDYDNKESEPDEVTAL